MVVFALLMILVAVFSTSALIRLFILKLETNESSSLPPAPNALSLRLILNSTQISEGKGVAATASLYNPLNHNVTLTISTNTSIYNTISEWEKYDFVCGSGGPYGLMGLALFAGHYTPSNISNAQAPLHLAPPIVFPCTTNVEPYSAVFLPHSDTAVLRWPWDSASQGYKVIVAVNATTENCSVVSSENSTFFSFECGTATGLSGYWVWNSGYEFSLPNSTSSWNQFQAAHFREFSPGPYTLVAVDLWGQYTYAYFQVTQT
jgi:hypothetical protein